MTPNDFDPSVDTCPTCHRSPPSTELLRAEGGARRTDPSTSHAASVLIRAKDTTSKPRLLVVFSEKLPDGLTDEEAAHAAGLINTEYSKRCGELRKRGFLELTGEERPGASGQPRVVSRITVDGEWVLHRRRLER